MREKEKEERKEKERSRVNILHVVSVLPQDGPTITGEEKVYATGDVLSLNCTSGKSHPVATLKWFINSAEVSQTFAFLRLDRP